MLVDVFENFRNMCIKIYKLDPAKFLSALGLPWQAVLRKTEIKLDLLTDIDMLLMVEKGIRGGIFHSLYRYAKANNKYMKNNLYGCAMSQKLPVNNLEWIKDSQFNEHFIKNYNEESNEEFFLEVNVQYLEIIMLNHNDLPFLPERMKIEKVEKLVANLHDKTEYVIHIRNLKQALNHGIVLKKFRRVIIFNQILG